MTAIENKCISLSNLYNRALIWNYINLKVLARVYTHMHTHTHKQTHARIHTYAHIFLLWSLYSFCFVFRPLFYISWSRYNNLAVNNRNRNPWLWTLLRLWNIIFIVGHEIFKPWFEMIFALRLDTHTCFTCYLTRLNQVFHWVTNCNLAGRKRTVLTEREVSFFFISAGLIVYFFSF